MKRKYILYSMIGLGIVGILLLLFPIPPANEGPCLTYGPAYQLTAPVSVQVGTSATISGSMGCVTTNQFYYWTLPSGSTGTIPISSSANGYSFSWTAPSNTGLYNVVVSACPQSSQSACTGLLYQNPSIPVQVVSNPISSGLQSSNEGINPTFFQILGGLGVSFAFFLYVWMKRRH